MTTVYVITHDTGDELLYWSNEDGWGDPDSATEFSSIERERFNLPVNGEWTERELC